MVAPHAADTMPEEGDRPSALPVEGTSIGRYTVIDKVGSGGMGIVYRARDPSLHREVAIKLVRPARMKGKGGAQHRARLLREARAMAQLQHPNVIRVYDVGEHGDALFVAMEFVQGKDAAQWLRTESPNWIRIVEVFRAAGRGLAAAHNAGLVHRDFKPANILVGDDLRVRVLDFGLARTAEEVRGAKAVDDGEPDPDWCSQVTSDGVVIGTPAYMAPEQHAGLASQPATDQYGYCVSLWEALFGSLPFQGANARAMAQAKARGALQEPPAGAVPEALVELLARGLSPYPDDRFGSMPDVLRELRRIVEQANAGKATVSEAAAARSNRLPWVAFWVATVVALALWLRRDEPANGGSEHCTDNDETLTLRDAYRRAIATREDPSVAQGRANELQAHWQARGCSVRADEWSQLATPP